MTNEYTPASAVIREIIPHRARWTFRVETDGTNTKPGQFYEISIPVTAKVQFLSLVMQTT